MHVHKSEEDSPRCSASAANVGFDLSVLCLSMDPKRLMRLLRNSITYLRN